MYNCGNKGGIMSKLVVISGPSGVGKGTVVKLLQEKYQKENKKLYLSVSCTTREPREGEIDGVHYYFISEEEFKKRISNNDFFEYNVYGTGKYYGTPKSTILNYLNDGYDVILEIEVNGYKQIKEQYPDCIGIFIAPPSIDELYNRLINRGTETKDVIEKRIATARHEMQEEDLYHYVIVNEDGKSKEAMEEIYKILNT